VVKKKFEVLFFFIISLQIIIFAEKCDVEYCIYYEEFLYFDLAINREKEIKKMEQKKGRIVNLFKESSKERVGK